MEPQITSRSHRVDGFGDNAQVSSSASQVVGIDFGTTNSSVALQRLNGQVELVQFRRFQGVTTSSRSVLYAHQQIDLPRKPVSLWTGPAAIDHYLSADIQSSEIRRRFIQSLKSYLSARTLTGTEIFGRQYRFEDLVAKILGDLRQRATEALGFEVRDALVGRPVVFVGANSEEDNEFAVERLRRSFLQAGFQSVEFAMEPVAAAYAYESVTERDEILLIGDFGGGTTDFSLLRVERDGNGSVKRRVLGSLGVGIAGDAFDARIVRRLVSPALGSDSMARSLGKALPALPAWVYAGLERWHTLSFLRTPAVLEMLRTTAARALEPEKIAALRDVVENDLGYQLHQAVQRVKLDLSVDETAVFRFGTDAIHLEESVRREDFERWIEPEREKMERALETLLTEAEISTSSVDKVFLTGGTSLVPAVRRIFTDRFSVERVSSGEAFTSVAEGLARMAAER